jgi:hypothetical protein
VNLDAVSLDQALPDDVVANSSLGIFAYRNYPVFSLPWLRKRSLLFGIAIGLFSLLVLIGMWVGSQKIQSAIMSAAHFFIAFMVMASAGPSLATWVRYRRFAFSKERSGVVIAVLLGIVAGYGVDRWSSAYLEKTIVTRSSTGANVDEASGKLATSESGKIVVNSDLEKRAREPWLIAINGIFLIMIYGALGGGLALRAYFSEQRRLTASQHKRELNAMRLQKDEAALRLGVLQAQVEPHFLFNTLASLRSLVRQDPALAETMIDALVDHLRATIPKLRGDSAKLFSTLGQQIDICSSYLTLMQVRMGSRLSYEINVPIHFREYEFPPLMLISLVENAIKHGLETKAGTGHIEIRAEKIVTDTRDEKLQVSVLDNGLGLSAGLGGGLGLSNIREQLKVRFSDAATLSIATRPEGGTAANIEIPLLMNKENT